MEPYYYSRMSGEMKAAYYPMLQGLNNLADEIQLPRLDGRQLSDVFFYLRLDHPEIFWAVSFKYKYYQDSSNLIFLPEYLFQKNKIREHQKAMKARVDKLARAAKDMSEEEKEVYIHDFICQNVTYDKLKKPYSHEIIGPLGQGVGVCEGIAKSVKVLCDALNVWCIIAICGNNPDKGIKYRHTWNILKIRGEYVHLDVTFDNSLGKGREIRYDYFNLCDRQIFRDHEPVLMPTPACSNGDLFYYRKKKLSFTKEEEVYNRSRQAAKKRKTLIFHWRGGYLTKEVFMNLLLQMRKAGQEQNKVAEVSVNWAQSVIRLNYLTREEADEKAVETGALKEVSSEEANEGELYLDVHAND